MADISLKLGSIPVTFLGEAATNARSEGNNASWLWIYGLPLTMNKLCPPVRAFSALTSLFLVSLCLSSLPLRASWQIQEIAGPGSMYAQDMTVDSAGQVHLCFHQANQLKYALWAGTTWKVEVVDSTMEDQGTSNYVDRHISMAHDSQNQPWILYQSASALKIAKRIGGVWSVETVRTGNTSGPRLALAPGDQPFVTYTIFTSSSKLFLATPGSPSWSSAEVNLGASVNATDLQVDSAGRLHLGAVTTSGVVYARRETNGNWARDTLRTATGAGYVTITEGPGEELHFLYANGGPSYYRGSLGSWTAVATTGTVVPTDDHAAAFSQDGTLHVLTTESGHLELQGTTWVRKDNFTHSLQNPVLALDPTGRFHFFGRYGSSGSSVIWVGYYGQEHSSPVGLGLITPSNVGLFDYSISSVAGAIGPAGDARVLYRGGNQMLYAVRKFSGWQTSTFPYSFFNPDMTVDAQGYTHVVSLSGPGVQYFYQTAGGWQQENAATNTFTGGDVVTNRHYGPAIAVSDAGIVHVAFVDNGKAFHARRSLVGVWTRTNLGTASGNSQIADLALDALGNPHVAFGGSSNRLIYRAYNGSTWSNEIAQEGNYVSASRPELLVDHSGTPFVFYASKFPNTNNSALACARKVGGVWTSEYVFRTINGDPFDAELDPWNRPRVAFLSSIAYPDDQYLVATFANGKWFSQQMERGNAGYSIDNSWMGLDPFGNMHLVLFRASSGWPAGQYGLNYLRENWRAPTFAAWQALQSQLSPGTAPGGPEDSFLEDGVPNLIKFAQGLQADSRQGSPVVQFSRLPDQTDQTCELKTQLVMGRPELIIRLQISTDLVNWDTIATCTDGYNFSTESGTTVTVSGIGDQRNILIHYSGNPAASALFARAKFELTAGK